MKILERSVWTPFKHLSTGQNSQVTNQRTFCPLLLLHCEQKHIVISRQTIKIRRSNNREIKHRVFFSRERQRWSRDPTFPAFAVCRPPFLLEGSRGGHFSRLEGTWKREYLRPIFTHYFILIACFYSYASFVILLLHELRVKLRVSNSSRKYITSPYPFFLVAVNGDGDHLPLEN